MKLSVTPLKVVSERRDPVKQLKEGKFDIKSDGLCVQDESGDVDDLESRITAFINKEEVRPVSLNLYFKAQQLYNSGQITPITAIKIKGA